MTSSVGRNGSYERTPRYSQITQLAQTSRIGVTFRCFPGLSLRMMAQGVRTQTHFQSAQHLNPPFRGFIVQQSLGLYLFEISN